MTKKKKASPKTTKSTAKSKAPRRTTKAKKVGSTSGVEQPVSNYAIPIGLLWILISLAIGLGIVFMTLTDKLDSLEQKITQQKEEFRERQKERQKEERENKEDILKEVKDLQIKEAMRVESEQAPATSTTDDKTQE